MSIKSISIKTIGIGLLVVGLLIIAVALTAGYTGLSPSPRIGVNKLIVASVGLVVGIVGGVLMARRKAK